MSRTGFDRRYRLPLLGLDEVGLGCIAGPLVVAGVVLPNDIECWQDLESMGLKDSKQMTEPARNRVSGFIRDSGIWYRIGVLDPWDMRKNTLFDQTTHLFRKIAVEARSELHVATVLVDGNARARMGEHVGIPKGDDKSLTVAAASVMAKAWRDAFMIELAKSHLGYDWAQNKGYPVPVHVKSLMTRGVTRWHRMFTRPVEDAVRDGARRVEAPAG